MMPLILHKIRQHLLLLLDYFIIKVNKNCEYFEVKFYGNVQVGRNKLTIPVDTKPKY